MTLSVTSRSRERANVDFVGREGVDEFLALEQFITRPSCQRKLPMIA